MTGPEELITASGKLNGLALIEIPLMLVTVSWLGEVAGNATLKGVDTIGVGECRQSPMSTFVRSKASRRIIP